MPVAAMSVISSGQASPSGLPRRHWWSVRRMTYKEYAASITAEHDAIVTDLVKKMQEKAAMSDTAQDYIPVDPRPRPLALMVHRCEIDMLELQQARWPQGYVTGRLTDAGFKFKPGLNLDRPLEERLVSPWRIEKSDGTDSVTYTQWEFVEVEHLAARPVRPNP